MRETTGVSHYLHQILRLPRKINRNSDPHHIWNVIYNARSEQSEPRTSPTTAPATQSESHAWSVSRMKRHLHHIWNVIYNARSEQSEPRTSPTTAPATQSESHAWSVSRMKRHLQCAKQQEPPSNFTKCCACHAKWIASVIRITYETSFTMRGASKVNLEPHQLLRLPRKMNLMLDPCHIWNVIYNARNNRSLPLPSPNTVPATQNESHQCCKSHMKRHFQCAQQAKPPSNLTKYCACHTIVMSTFQRRIPALLPPIERRFEHIRTYSEHIRRYPKISEDKIVISHPPLRRPSPSDLFDDFVLKNTTFRAPAISQTVTKCCACHEKSQSTFTKYCACHEKSTGTVTLLKCYSTELWLYWTVTLLILYWTVTLLNCYPTELWLYWNCYCACHEQSTGTVTLLKCDSTELWLYWYSTELWLYWTVTLLNCDSTELLLRLPRKVYWNCDSTEVWLYWTVTLLILYWTVTLLNCYSTELWLYWTVTLLNCDSTELWLYWTVTLLNCDSTELLLYWNSRQF